MKKLYKQIEFFCLALKEKMLVKRLSKHLNNSFTNSTSKTILSSTETMTLTSETDKKREKVLDDVTSIMISCRNNPKKMLDYIEKHGTNVYVIKNNSKLLKNIGEDDGFILPQKGLKAFMLNTFLNKSLAFKTPALFVFREEMLDEYYILQQFYKWQSYCAGLPGFDDKIQTIFKKYMHKGFDISKLSLEETLALKEAVARDSEATSFAIEVARLKDGGKNVLNKMQDGGANI